MELEREWPEYFYKAVRRVAGQNAARQEPIIWIIGVDEERRVSFTLYVVPRSEIRAL
jgi:hypothetical protein